VGFFLPPQNGGRNDFRIFPAGGASPPPAEF